MKTILSIYSDVDELYEESKYIYELWMRKVAEREVKRKQLANKVERTSYQLSLEFHGASFRIRWLYVRFVKNGDRIIRISKSIAVPRNYLYSRSKFKYADSWELDLICQIEEVLSPIRAKKAALMKAHQTLLRLNKYLGNAFTYTSSRERVTPTSNTIPKYKSRLSN